MARPSQENRVASDVDRHIGARIRDVRKEREKKQADLAYELGISHQQLDKYERGLNRISAGRLYEIANKLGVPAGLFFENLPAPMLPAAAGAEA